MVELILVLLLGGLLALPLGWYLALVMRGAAASGDRFFLPIERALYAMLGTAARGSMRWTVYAGAFLASNLALGLMVWLLLMTQAWLPLNPAGVPNMSWDLALHTAISFLTNTNQQHYSGQAQISYLSHMAGIVTLQVVTPMPGPRATSRWWPTPARREVLRHGVPVVLSRKEYALLVLLVRHADRVVTQTQILREVWGPGHHEDTHYLRVLVGKLRARLGEEASAPRYIVTEPGVGLRFVSGSRR